MNIATATTPTLPQTHTPSVEPRLSAALDASKSIEFALSLAAGPMPSAASVRQAAAGAHQVADEIWAGDARRGDIYGPSYTAASVLAKAGAEALDSAAHFIETYNEHGQRGYDDILGRQAILASSALTDALANLQSIRDAGA
jgi:hypothetical protein